MILYIFAVLIAGVYSQCPWGYTALNGETRCQNSNYCQALGGNTYECLNGQCCRINGLCNSQEVAINGECYRMATNGERCSYSAQCQPMGSSECDNGICRSRSNQNERVCINPQNVVEYLNNGQYKNCMYNQCSSGYNCEYSQLAQQYICCGFGPGSTRQYDDSLGRVRLYPRTTMPLQCSTKKGCMFDDTPNCVYSSRYGHYVCCTTFNC